MLRSVHQNIKWHECELIFSIFSRVKKVFFSCSSKSSPTPTPLDNSWSRQRPRPIRFGSLLFTSFYHLQHIHMHAISQAKGEFKQNHTVQCSLPKFYSFTRCYGSHVGDWLNYWVVRLICVFKNASKIGLAVKAANLKITGRPVLDKIMGDLLQTERVHISWYTSTTPTPELRRHSKKPVYTSWERNLLHFYMVTGAKAKGCELVETLSSTNDSRSPTVQSSQQAGFFSCSCQKASAIWDVALGQLHPY